MRVAFDTNVLLSEIDDCKKILGKLIENESPEVKIAVDVGGLIEAEYMEESEKRQDRSILQDVTRLILSNAGVNDPYVERLDSNLLDQLPNSECTHLNPLQGPGCHLLKPAERALLGIGHKYGHDAYVYLLGKATGDVQRCYTNHYDEVCNHVLKDNAQARETLDELLDKPCPETYAALSAILNALNRNNAPREDERHDFKLQLDQTVFEKLPQTICAMLNKDGGYIFLGVSEKPYEVRGFYWKEVGAADEDGVVLQIVSKINDSIDPPPGDRVRVSWIKRVPANALPACAKRLDDQWVPRCDGPSTCAEHPSCKILIVIRVLPKPKSALCYRRNRAKKDKDKGVFVRCGSSDRRLEKCCRADCDCQVWLDAQQMKDVAGVRKSK